MEIITNTSTKKKTLNEELGISKEKLNVETSAKLGKERTNQRISIFLHNVILRSQVQY